MRPTSSISRPRVAFICGKGGGDYLALEKARSTKFIDYETVAFVSVSEQSPAFRHFREVDPAVPFRIAASIRTDREKTFSELLAFMESASPDWIFLCGFGFLLPYALVAAFPGNIINTHHAPLPEHPGLFRKEWLVELGEQQLGATVHYVDEGMDTGPIIGRALFPNFGMSQFDKVLRYYRFVQDVLIVQAFRDVVVQLDGNRVADFSGIRFVPPVEKRIIELYSGDHGLA